MVAYGLEVVGVRQAQETVTEVMEVAAREGQQIDKEYVTNKRFLFIFISS